MAGLYMAFGRDSWRLGAQMPGRVGAGALSGLVGFFSALMGIGGGTFGVPLMTLYNMPIHRAVGTASGFGVLIAVPAVLGFLLLNVADAPPYTVGAVSIPAFLIVIGSTLITTPLGAVSYTHLDVYKRQGYRRPSGLRTAWRPRRRIRLRGSR